MQYIVRNRRRLRPATGELVRGIPTPVPAPAVSIDEQPARVAEGSGLHRRPLVTEINLTRPFAGRVR